MTGLPASDTGRRRDRPGWKAIRYLGGVLSLVGGGFATFLTMAVGHCSAFGGTCPADGLEGDVIGGIALGLGVTIGGPMIAWRPDRVGVVRAIAVGGAVGLLVALLMLPSLTNG